MDLHQLEIELEKAWPPRLWRDSHVMLAVSGGADSVAMLRAVGRLKQRFGGKGGMFVAHLNHGLRDTASDDAKWLQDLCDRFGLPLEIGEVDVAAMATKQGDGVESTAREARYEFLAATAERIGARYVCTAHTADDQIETLLFRILRGTGIAGLAGIRRVRTLSPSVSLVRPMLRVRRHEVLEYLAKLEQDYRTDETNADNRIARNRIRNELLPLLRARFSADVDTALLRLADQAAETQEEVDRLSQDLLRSAVELVSGPLGGDAVDSTVARPFIRIRCADLAGASPLLAREVCKSAWQHAGWPLQAMGFREWSLLAGMVRVGSPKTANLPGNVRARCDDGHVALERFGLP